MPRPRDHPRVPLVPRSERVEGSRVAFANQRSQCLRQRPGQPCPFRTVRARRGGQQPRSTSVSGPFSITTRWPPSMTPRHRRHQQASPADRRLFGNTAGSLVDPGGAGDRVFQILVRALRARRSGELSSGATKDVRSQCADRRRIVGRNPRNGNTAASCRKVAAVAGK